jgi:chromosome partitioning protein
VIADWAARRVKAGLRPFHDRFPTKRGEMVATIEELQSHQFVLIDLEGTASRLLSRAFARSSLSLPLILHRSTRLPPAVQLVREEGEALNAPSHTGWSIAVTRRDSYTQFPAHR